MNPVENMVKQLELLAHPEGGYYKRVFCSEDAGMFGAEGRHRPLCTAIIYLLNGKQYSAFHRIKSEELWLLGEANSALRIIELQQGKIVETLLCREHPVHCVKANTWFASELVEKNEDAYALAYCTVVPGFDFADFELADKSRLLLEYPDQAELVSRLCIRTVSA